MAQSPRSPSPLVSLPPGWSKLADVGADVAASPSRAPRRPVPRGFAAEPSTAPPLLLRGSAARRPGTGPVGAAAAAAIDDGSGRPEVLEDCAPKDVSHRTKAALRPVAMLSRVAADPSEQLSRAKSMGALLQGRPLSCQKASPSASPSSPDVSALESSSFMSNTRHAAKGCSAAKRWAGPPTSTGGGESMMYEEGSPLKRSLCRTQSASSPLDMAIGDDDVPTRTIAFKGGVQSDHWKRSQKQPSRLGTDYNARMRALTQM
mmetsp:Transcript_69826/g.196903  ORF Transcript_69826/g.196903 Transcript_69826/m.196903 type:complete len:261 (-) Transcript_69826:41-823(-)